MHKIFRHILVIMAAAVMCTRFEPGHISEAGPYIDSLGLRASLARIDNVGDQSAGSLINEALKVPETGEDVAQADFFKSLEDNYQKYLKLFRFHKVRNTPGAISSYDLLETFRGKVYDPQPFLNAILHTMTLREITTLDYIVQSEAPDTIRVQVAWAKMARQSEKSFGITEGSLQLVVTKHAVSIGGPLPKSLKTGMKGKK